MISPIFEDMSNLLVDCQKPDTMYANCAQKSPTVYVMLAAHNGAKVIKEQVNSILCQSEVNVRLYIFDDCSTDDTLEICRCFKKSASGVEIISSEVNLGVNEAMWTLLNSVPQSRHAYYAFCDQDDYWLPEKLTKAVQLICERGEVNPVVYCSGVQNVDENGTFLSFDYDAYANSCREIGTALLTNYSTGCTMVFNSALLSLVKQYHPSFKGYLFDEWVYLVGHFCGIDICDLTHSYIRRRIGAHNLEGAEKKGCLRLLTSLRNWNARSHIKSDLCKELLDQYSGEMSDAAYEFLLQASRANDSLASRVAFASSPFISQPTKIRSLFQRMKILLGHF